MKGGQYPFEVSLGELFGVACDLAKDRQNFHTQPDIVQLTRLADIETEQNRRAGPGDILTIFNQQALL